MTRVEIILIMGLMAFVLRALPQLFFVGRKFPVALDRLLQFLSYAFICSIVSVTLFMTGPRFDAAQAPYRGLALGVTIAVARKTRNPVLGMLGGALLVQLGAWLR